MIPERVSGQNGEVDLAPLRYPAVREAFRAVDMSMLREVEPEIQPSMVNAHLLLVEKEYRENPQFTTKANDIARLRTAIKEGRVSCEDIFAALEPQQTEEPKKEGFLTRLGGQFKGLRRAK